MTTKIEWVKNSDGTKGKTWNPVTGCTKISEGCKHCYAERMSKRLAGRCGYDKEEPFKVTLHQDKLDEPLHWKKPSKIFVCSMGDLFHDDVPDRFLDQIFAVMALCTGHAFLTLTKRPERMRGYICDWQTPFRIAKAIDALIVDEQIKQLCNIVKGEQWAIDTPIEWPPKNWWAGVTAENQQRADERIPILLQIPAAVRFVSVEPMLGPVDLTQIDIGGNVWINSLTGDCKSYHPYGGLWKINESKNNKLDWIICGGETGPGARPMRSAWVISLRDQCQEAGTPFFFKSWGEWVRPSQMPASTYREIEDYGNGIGIADLPLGVGKKRSGRLLDGVEWNEYPEGGQ